MSKNCKAIHETYLKDIIDLFTDLKDMDLDLIDKNKPLSGQSSIAKASSNLTMVFPVLCSRNIDISRASMISKAVEKNAVTMLQRLFACYQLADAGDVKNVKDFVSMFHTNINSTVASLDDIFELVGSVAENGRFSYEAETAIREDMKNINHYLPSSISESSLSRFSILEGKASSDIPEVSLSKKDEWQIRKNSSDYFKNQIIDGDIKKANELMPTMVQVNCRIQNKDGKTTDLTPAVFGVKAKLYPIASEDIVKHIADKTISRNWITNFIRATTREISFMKDFVMAIDKAKIDAMSLSDRKGTSDRMWKVLERRATISRLKKFMHSSNNAAAITTLCVSQDEVEYLRKYNNIDLERIAVVRGLFDSLNIMCICIVDENLEIAKFIFDEDEPTWETISFTHLERESSDNTYKRVVNLMTKMH